MNPEQLSPGQRVRVSQRTERREGDWVRDIVGTVVSVASEQTGSWCAHGKDHKLWLRRIRLQRDDGEQTTIVVDQHIVLEQLAEAPGSSSEP